MANYTIPSSALDIMHDINTREIVDRFIYGSNTEPPRGEWVVLQRVKKDADGNPIKSPYAYKLTGEAKGSDHGPNTTRTGYLCEEFLVRAYPKPATRKREGEELGDVGKLAFMKRLFIFSYKDKPSRHDVLCTLKLNDDGSLINPVTADEEMVLAQVFPQRLEDGSIQFYEAIAEKQS